MCHWLFASYRVLLSQIWSSSRPDMELFLARYGLLLGQIWTSSLPDMELFFSRYGALLGKIWISSWPDMDFFIARSGLLLCQIWSCSLPDIDFFLARYAYILRAWCLFCTYFLVTCVCVSHAPILIGVCGMHCYFLCVFFSMACKVCFYMHRCSLIH